jgi:hypothetical protein
MVYSLRVSPASSSTTSTDYLCIQIQQLIELGFVLLPSICQLFVPRPRLRVMVICSGSVGLLLAVRVAQRRRWGLYQRRWWH